MDAATDLLSTKILIKCLWLARLVPSLVEFCLNERLATHICQHKRNMSLHFCLVPTLAYSMYSTGYHGCALVIELLCQQVTMQTLMLEKTGKLWLVSWSSIFLLPSKVKEEGDWLLTADESQIHVQQKPCSWLQSFLIDQMCGSFKGSWVISQFLEVWQRIHHVDKAVLYVMLPSCGRSIMESD